MQIWGLFWLTGCSLLKGCIPPEMCTSVSSASLAISERLNMANDASAQTETGFALFTSYSCCRIWACFSAALQLLLTICRKVNIVFLLPNSNFTVFAFLPKPQGCRSFPALVRCLSPQSDAPLLPPAPLPSSAWNRHRAFHLIFPFHLTSALLVRIQLKHLHSGATTESPHHLELNDLLQVTFRSEKVLISNYQCSGRRLIPEQLNFHFRD